MLKRFSLAVLSFAFAAASGYSQSTEKVTIPVSKTAANSGKQMFASYCASCHGEDGKGAGPAAAALKITPVDLTMLSKKNGGKFPDRHTIAVLEFGEQTAAHGSAAMPVWGPALGKLNPSNSSDRPMRISNLIRYLESIQAK